MTPEHWQRVKQLLQSTLERKPNERSAFLAEACAGDESLRKDVEELIISHEEAGSFIDDPPLNVYAEMLAAEQTESLVGQAFGPYRILSQLGAGGMGEVYLAEDARLGRKVALKLLPSYFTQDRDRVRRFRQEARSASALNHPNIITIHEIGEVNDQQFIVTEFIDGETIRERMNRARMTLSEALDIATQVTSALDEAHRAGIIHRDIKPENIMVRGSGLVKVLDFGLAKLTEKSVTQATGSEVSTVIQTDPHVVMGTVNYMSPEQARGRAMDARSDIFSLGVVLYEMITGRKPFEGETVADTLIAVLQEEPLRLGEQRPETPAELERIVKRALQKERQKRYQTAQELLHDLKNLNKEIEFAAKLEQSAMPNASGEAATPGSGEQTAIKTVGEPSPRPTSSAEYIVTEIKHHKRGTAIFILATLIIAIAIYTSLHFLNSNKTISSLAILPFVNATADPNMEYLSDGITESLINNLSRLPHMKVMSRSSVFRYKGKETDVQMIGRELGVEAVLTGRVMQREDGLSISIELVDARDNSHIWGEQYNRKLSDILAVQEAISREVSEKLRVQLTGEEQKRLSKPATQNPEAYQLYLKGRYYLSKRTDEGLKKAIDYFNQTIEKDSSYALAYSGLADSNMYLLRLGFLHDLSPKEVYLRAKLSATKALEIDDNLAEAHTSLALVKMEYEWDWPGSEGEFTRALELNPNEAEAHHQYSHYLTAVGRTHESLVESLRALELDPLSLPLNAHLGWHYLYARQYDQAVEQCRKTSEMDPNYPQAHDFLAGAYEQKGMYEEAITEFQKAINLSGDSSHIKAELGHAYAIAGKGEEALKIIDELKGPSKETYISPYDVAAIYVGLGQKDQAFEWLQKASEDRSDWLRYLKVDPRLDPLRLDPRFADLVRRVGLPQ
jgi:serine/threonine protein kinase/Tfp pilus assembly protein PilF